jgi:ribosomal protein S18 acetylase RimI-like enzyme
MDAVESRLRELGIADMIIGVVATNVAAIEFYERRGAAPFDSRLIQRVQSS